MVNIVNCSIQHSVSVLPAVPLTDHMQSIQKHFVACLYVYIRSCNANVLHITSYNHIKNLWQFQGSNCNSAVNIWTSVVVTSSIGTKMAYMFQLHTIRTLLLKLFLFGSAIGLVAKCNMHCGPREEYKTKPAKKLHDCQKERIYNSI